MRNKLDNSHFVITTDEATYANFQGRRQNFQKGVVSEAICLRIVPEKHIILAMILVKGNVLQSSVSQPISDIGNLITPALSIDEICCSVSQLSNGNRRFMRILVQKRNLHLTMT